MGRYERSGIFAGERFGRWVRVIALFHCLIGILTFGCSRDSRTEPGVEVAVIAEALSAADWPADGLVVESSTQLDTAAQVVGNVTVRTDSTAPLARTRELVFESNAQLSGNARAIQIHFENGGVIAGNAQYTVKHGPGQATGVQGTSTTPLSVPVSVALPTMPAVSPGGQPITVASGATQTKAAGTYATVTLNSSVGAATRLILTGGTYHFSSINVGYGARLECSADCEVRVNGRVAVDHHSFIGASGSGLTPRNMRLVVKGANGAAGPNGLPAALAVNFDSQLEAYVFAPNGTVRFGDRLTSKGKIVAKDVYFGPQSTSVLIDRPTISQQPVSTSVRATKTVTFSVTATGAQLTYQWKRNGTNINGATGPTLSFTADNSHNGATHTVVVTNAAGSVTSTGAVLTVIPCTATDATCNGDDEDCNGVNDDDYVVTCQGASRQVCTNGTVVSSACGDSNVCNGTETCSAGSCQAGTPLTVNDNNPCTADSCNPTTGVINTPVASGTACADGNLCNGNETCNASGSCLAGIPPTVNDNNPCTADACSPTTGVSHVPVASGTACPDGNLCNGNETCNGSGACVAGVPPVVDDGNPCTGDFCHPTGGVLHGQLPAGNPCPDGNLCNGNETCNASAVCVAGTPPVVNDGNPCTADACSPTTGVSHTLLASGTACNDSTLCNGWETCNAYGTCVAGTPPVIDDYNPCTTDVCDASAGVVHLPVPQGTTCTDGDACNGEEICGEGTGVCQAGVALTVDDGNPCTADSCDPVNGVAHTPVAEGTSCSDENACNGAEMCSATGTCEQGPPPFPAGTCTAACIDAGCCSDCVGYASGGFWRGRTWAVATQSGTGEAQATLNVPTSLNQFPLCVSGSVDAQVPGEPAPAAMIGWNVAQEQAGDPVTINPSEPGLDVQITNFGSAPLRVELHGPNADTDPNQRWCASVPSGGGFVPYTSFAANCSPEANGTAYANESYATVVLSVQGVAAALTEFEFCINGVEQSDLCVASLELDDGDPTTLDRCDPAVGPVHVPIPQTDPAAQSTVLSDNKWLVETGVQTELAPGELEPRRVALVRGHVVKIDGTPIANVDVRIHGRPELGHTTTHADGSFDMLINGGGTLELEFDRTPKFLASARTVDVAWNGTTDVGKVVLIRPDRRVSKVRLDTQTSSFIAAVGSTMTDSAGTRTAAVLFPPGVEALMVGEDGSSQALNSLSVRITEFTVGPEGPAAMPANLAHNTAYTYAFEINADEAVLSKAPEILFSKSLPFYMHNFMEFPVGALVPLGSYDRLRSKWVPDRDGIVLEIVGIQAGLADIDLTGDGVADGAAELEAWGITDAERQKLAELCAAGVYAQGDTLQRIQISHFTSPWDANTGYEFPDDGKEVGDDSAPTPQDPEVDDPSKTCNASMLEGETQVFHEAIPVVGTPFSLHYNSERVPGRIARYSVRGKISSGSLPESLLRVTVDLHVGGNKVSKTYWRANAGQDYEVIWNGLDVHGRRLYGPQDATLKLCYVYQGKRVVLPSPPSGSGGGGGGGGGSFSAGGGSALGIRTESDPEVESCRRWPVVIGLGNVSAGLGEWTLNVHHQISGRQGTVLLGDGTSHHATSLAPVTVGVAGSKPSIADFNGVDARSAHLPGVYSIQPSMVAGADGSLYYSDGSNGNRIRKVGADGQLSTVAGGGEGADGGPAVGASVGTVSGIDVDRDGVLYFGESNRGQVRKVENGIITTVAGTLLGGTVSPQITDRGIATQQRLGNVWDVRVAPDGSLYIASGGRVTRVDANGYVRPIAGKASGGDTVHHDAQALEVLMDPRRLAFSPAGDLYILHSNTYQGSLGHRIYRLEGDKLKLVAGCEEAPCSRTIGVLADAFTLDSRQRDALTFDKTGTLYFIGDLNAGLNDDFRVLTIDRGGRIRGVFSGPLDHREGLIAAEANLDAFAIAYSPLGLMTYHKRLPPGGTTSQITALTRNPEVFGGSARVIASASGDEAYVFDESGRHLETRDAYTSAVKYSFTYDDNGWLETVTDARATVPQVTTIERDSTGVPLAIVGPFGHRTTIHVNGDQQLEHVIDPLQRTFTMTYYSTSGLLQSFENPRHGTGEMTYDSQGRIFTDEDAADKAMTFARTDLSDTSWQVVRSTHLGRETKYVVDRTDAAAEVRTTTAPDETETTVTRTAARSTSVFGDGSVLEVLQTPDDRWGAAAPKTKTTLTLPSGRQHVVNRTRTTTLSNALDPYTVQTVSDRQNVNGRLTTTNFYAATRQYVTITPANRVITRTVDAFGRTERMEFGGFHPVSISYDSRGRVDLVTQGTRTLDFGYGTSGGGNGLLSTIVDPLQRTTTLQRDLAGRVELETFQGLETAYTWDGLDNLTSVTPPGKPIHQMDYTPVNLLSVYEPPVIPEVTAPNTIYTYDGDRMLDTVTLPDGSLIDVTPDGPGRVGTVQLPTGLLSYGYYAANATAIGASPGALASLSGPYGTTLSYQWDGPLMTSEATAAPGGLSTVTVRATYDTETANNDLVVTEQELDATGPSSYLRFGYDQDLLLTCVATTTCPGGTDALTLARGVQHGMVTELFQGDTSETFTYNNYGELATQTSQISGTPLLATTYDHSTKPRDALGRITRKTEVRAGVTKVTDYAYYSQGPLHQVHVDGVLAESYTYDDNGNRLTGFELGSGSRAGAYDDQDRLTSYGPWTYTYTANGELASKTETNVGETTYTYDAVGNLLDVTLPDGRFIEYLTDGRHRRIAKKVNGAVVRRWVYQDQLNPTAELDGNGTVLYRYAYGSMAHSPDFVVNATGETYRVIRDQLGSPLLVVNIHDENDVLLEARYSAFGNRTVIAGDGSALTLGFAGGIYDEDTGLTRFGARDYDATVGRWTSKDPIRWGGGQGNLYAYASNDAVNLVDPSGLAVPALDGRASETAALSAASSWLLDSAQTAWSSGHYGSAVVDAASGVAVAIASALSNPVFDFFGLTAALSPAQIAERTALHQLLKEALKNGGGKLSSKDAQGLKDLARGIGTKGEIHGPHEAPVDFPHAHIDSKDHIPICP